MIIDEEAVGVKEIRKRTDSIQFVKVGSIKKSWIFHYQFNINARSNFLARCIVSSFLDVWLERRRFWEGGLSKVIDIIDSSAPICPAPTIANCLYCCELITHLYDINRHLPFAHPVSPVHTNTMSLLISIFTCSSSHNHSHFTLCIYMRCNLHLFLLFSVFRILQQSLF